MRVAKQLVPLLCIVLALAAFSGCRAAQDTSPAYTEAGNPIVDWPHSSNLVYARAPELLRTYTSFQIARPAILDKEEDSFADVSLDEQAAMLFFTRQAYAQAFDRNGFDISPKSGPGIACVQIYLLDMRPSHAAAEGVLYKTPLGDLDLSDADFRGRSVFTGGVTLVGVITDSVSGKTLMGFVESSSQTNLDPVRAFERWFPAQSAVESSAGSLAIGWRALMKP